VQNGVEAAGDVERAGDIAPEEREAGVAFERFEVGLRTRGQIVDGDDVPPSPQKSSAQMGTEEPCSAGDKSAHGYLLEEEDDGAGNT
jgi:hypothetical protein